MSSIFSRLGAARLGGSEGGGGSLPEGAAPPTGELPRPLDAKALPKLYKRMDRVVRSLQNPRLNLSRSPPCLIDTLPDIYLKLKDISKYYETPDRRHLLEQNDFFYITVNNIFDKCKRVNMLFKDHKEDIFLESSDSRKQLVNLTIVIAYIFADLKALFSDAQFNPHFRIAKEEAERWWKETFPDKVIVPWAAFKDQCCSIAQLTKLELSKLKSTIDLTCNDHVSIFEFDVFTRLFAPWSMLMKNFKRLTFHPGYMASATFENVKAILSQYRDKAGSYVFRMSCTKLGFWSIGYVTDHSEQRRDAISQIVVRDGKPIVEALMEGSAKGFYLYPYGEQTNPDLSELMHVRPKPQFQVTEAQFEEYSMIGSTFQECKICNLRDKDIRLDLCGHFMCSKCLSQWLSKGSGCPFCRCEIRSTQSVVMRPFSPAVSPCAESPPSPVSLPQPTSPPPPLPPGYDGAETTRKLSLSTAPVRNAPLPPQPALGHGAAEEADGASPGVYVNLGAQEGSREPPTSLELRSPPAESTTPPGGSASPVCEAAAPVGSVPRPVPPPKPRVFRNFSRPTESATSPGVSSPLSGGSTGAGDSDVFGSPLGRSADQRILGQLPPPPPPPIPSSGSSLTSVDGAPRPRQRRRLQPPTGLVTGLTGSPPAHPEIRPRTRAAADPELNALPPPPPVPPPGPRAPLSSAEDGIYQTPVEDAYQVPRESLYLEEEEEDAYHVPREEPVVEESPLARD